ncbi:hypothetical protein RJ639_005363 [Escallonia herrerae]|uniref:Pentatricopeptide repeat-containing protein n=1 Tax=Escallonia herrerae TaxID=1293975 RepID=A0AA88W3D2_9ASTE|nr:hypothetical protein RJ639_005363 [Escallonia herrerae]
MPERSVRSWTSMIAGFVQCGKPKEAVHIFSQMEEARLVPNETTSQGNDPLASDIHIKDMASLITLFNRVWRHLWQNGSIWHFSQPFLHRLLELQIGPDGGIGFVEANNVAPFTKGAEAGAGAAGGIYLFGNLSF